MKDFFVSYNSHDLAWAEWIGWILEEAGYSVVIQAWDFRPGGNFVLEMQAAAVGTEKTIAVLSHSYLDAEYTQPEWAAAWVDDPRGLAKKLIPIRVGKCQPTGLLKPIIYADCVEVSETVAKQRVLDALLKRAKPPQKPPFPGASGTPKKPSKPNSVSFPGQIWNVPYDRNTFFTGREQILTGLRQRLTKESTAALSQTQAISGLGGIGKTQTAVEYAYRYAQDYQAVFWVRAETRTEIITEFVEIARRLELPQADAQDPMDTVNAVKRWLGKEIDWLLVFDNADTPELVKEFRPQQFKGYILLTSRAQRFDTLGITNPVSLDKMEPQEAQDFLLKRTNRVELADPAELAAINELEKELDYFPLALEQAGAYILQQEVQVQDYLASFSRRRLTLLEQSAPVTGNYPASVATTWSLNFEQVSNESEVSADILRASAFFSPDAIPYELLLDGASELGDAIAEALAEGDVDPLRLNELLTPLARYSLIRREPANRAYSIYRLVQEVLKNVMEPDEYRTWAERVVYAVCQVFPNAEFENWQQCDRLLPQAQVAALLAQDFGFKSKKSALLFGRLGSYFDDHSQYQEAESCFLQALRWRQELFGEKHPYVATSLNNLAGLYSSQGRYEQAEPLYLQALQLSQELSGEKNSSVATSLNNLAGLYYSQGRYEQAEPLYLQALQLVQELLGDKHTHVALGMNNLARLYSSQGRYEQAEPLYLQALQLMQELFGDK
ncbi:MAG: toll/interleukin-1 receptor domain-containing protein, partial [Cyanobacteria bacterium J06597_1]